MYLTISYKQGMRLATPFPTEEEAVEFAKSLQSGRVIEVWAPCSCDEIDEPHTDLYKQFINGEELDNFVEVDGETGEALYAKS